MNEPMLPLHKTTHFRRLREVIVALTRKCNINVNDYDLFRITCYCARGLNLMGNNVTFSNSSLNRCCFVSDNSYEIYECPKKTNKHKYVGNYLVIAHNTSFDYWIVTIMNYKISVDKYSPVDKVVYLPKYCANVVYKRDKISIIPIEDLVDNRNAVFERGFNLGKTEKFAFDLDGSRSTAYQYTKHKYVLETKKNNNEVLSTDKAVTIYKKKHKKRR